MNIVDSRSSRWWQWILIIILISMGVSVSAFVVLVKLPAASSCSSRVSRDDAAEVIYCATTTVDEQNPEKLVAAIDLVNQIPQDNPLRENCDRLIAKWLNVLLMVSEKSFQQGDFSEVIDLMAEIPTDIPNYTMIKEKMQLWQSIWKQGEEIYEQAKTIVDAEERETWYKALEKAKELKKLDNEYWANNKYYELIQQIQAVREQAEKSEQDEKIAKQKQKENQIQDENLEQIGLFDKTQAKEDVAQLEKARKIARSGKIDDIRMAISEASLVISDTHYKSAQKLIKDWERQVEVAEDKLYLENAKKTALSGDVVSLQSAINEASLVRKDRPLHQQANQKIQQWQQQISKLNQSQAKISLPSANKISDHNVRNPEKSPKKPPNQESIRNETAPIPVFSPSRDISPATFKPTFQDIKVKEFELELINQESVSPSNN